MNILVTGSNGQLGTCLMQQITDYYNHHDYHFTTKKHFDITDIENIENILNILKPDIIINCAAYTNVEKAEEDFITAYNINTEGVYNLVKVCKENNIILIHISTDFVFDGSRNYPYKETDECNPLSMYGKTKLDGENIVIEYEKGIVIRTSWLYSEFGKNFFNTMLDIVQKGREVTVVSDQVGTPTYARDLAKYILDIINNGEISRMNGIYHFTNNGCCSWYDFAKAIEILSQERKNKDYIKPCLTNDYPSKARRPKYSVLSKERLGFQPRHWIEALIECINNKNTL